MRFRLLAAAAALGCLLAAPAGAFVTLSLPANGMADEPIAPACDADHQVGKLDAMLAAGQYKVLRLSGADAVLYHDGVAELFGSDLPEADLLVIVEVMPDGATDPDDAVEVVFGFKGGCFVYQVRASAPAHASVMQWIEQHRGAASAR